MADPTPSNRRSEQEELLFQCLEALEAGGSRAVEELLAGHPEHAAEHNLPGGNGFLTNSEVRGQDVGSIVIDDEALRLFDGNDHRALGQANLDASGGTLTVSRGNIGTSGEDGVSVALLDETQFTVDLDPVSLTNLNQAVMASGVVTLSGVPDTFVGTTGFVNNNGQVDALADFSPIGSSMVLVEVLNNGNLVGSSTVTGGGAVASTDVPPQVKGIINDTSGTSGCFGWCFSSAVMVSIPGAPTFFGDQVNLFPANPSGTIDSISGFDLTGTDLGSFTIVDESTSEDCGLVYCDATQNPNNSADIAIDTCDSSSGSIVVSLSDGPPNQFCYLLVGNGSNVVSQPPGAKGDLCVVGGSCLGRYDKDVGQVDGAGTFSIDIKNALSNPCAGGVDILPGATWNFQFWHRQPMGAPATFSSAVSVTFE